MKDLTNIYEKEKLDRINQMEEIVRNLPEEIKNKLAFKGLASLYQNIDNEIEKINQIVLSDIPFERKEHRIKRAKELYDLYKESLESYTSLRKDQVTNYQKELEGRLHK